MTIPATPDAPVHCPKCQSTQVHAEKRGWNAMTGILGSSAIRITCLKCGHQFKPGETAYVAPAGTNFGLIMTLVLLGILGLLALLNGALSS